MAVLKRRIPETNEWEPISYGGSGSSGSDGSNVYVGDEQPTDGSELWIDTDDEGAEGGSGSVGGGAYVGAEEPTDENVNLWYDTDEKQGRFYTAAETDAKFMQMVKLWENPNPTSAFAAQTVSLDLNGYDEIEIVVNLFSGIQATFKFKFSIPNCTRCMLFCTNNSPTYTNYGYYRLATVSRSEINFDTAYFNNSQGDQYLVPLQIYGIKGVQ